MTDKKPEIRVELLCVGAFETSKGTVAYEFHRIDALGQRIAKCLAWKKVQGTPGVVYSVVVPSIEEFETNGTMIPRTMMYVRPWPNEDERTQMQIRSRAVETALAAMRRSDKQEAEADEFKKLLAPIRKAYRASNRLGQAAILANIVQELNRYGSDD